jgi:heat shock protein HslJ
MLAGAWRILSINGSPPVSGSGDRLVFGTSGYSGSAGCNGMQGYYLAHARRFFAAPPIQTEMGCEGQVGDQEARVGRILAGSPAIDRLGSAEIEFTGEEGRMALRRIGEASWSPEGRPWRGEALEAELIALAGRPLQKRVAEPETRLRLGPERFVVTAGCGRLSGMARRREQRIEFHTDQEPQPKGPCAGALAARLPEFMRLFNGEARLQIGASGELLIADERAWLTGRVIRPNRRRRS